MSLIKRQRRPWAGGGHQWRVRAAGGGRVSPLNISPSQRHGQLRATEKINAKLIDDGTALAEQCYTSSDMTRIKQHDNLPYANNNNFCLSYVPSRQSNLGMNRECSLSAGSYRVKLN
ncbi:hypothetical protein EVAR_81085_1 [Eumeta japonica]|uniref:Uncharacterized protein n=1 Tax=Eumeta variegata TaxID=151549 RepID=A0A4C1T6P9_EUMVA|nr:hypothetical protein EVAR_81085_1 [Eumeta japonica]